MLVMILFCFVFARFVIISILKGYGIFTTRDIDNQKSILHAPDAVSIPLHDMRWRNENLPLYKERRRLWKNVFANVSL